MICVQTILGSKYVFPKIIGLDKNQTSALSRHPSDKFQKHILDTYQKPSKHLPDTFQILSRHLPDTFLTPTDTLQTPSSHPQYTHPFVKIFLPSSGWVVIRSSAMPLRSLQDCKISSRAEIPKLDLSVAIN